MLCAYCLLGWFTTFWTLASVDLYVSNVASLWSQSSVVVMFLKVVMAIAGMAVRFLIPLWIVSNAFIYIMRPCYNKHMHTGSVGGMALTAFVTTMHFLLCSVSERMIITIYGETSRETHTDLGCSSCSWNIVRIASGWLQAGYVALWSNQPNLRCHPYRQLLLTATRPYRTKPVMLVTLLNSIHFNDWKTWHQSKTPTSHPASQLVLTNLATLTQYCLCFAVWSWLPCDPGIFPSAAIVLLGICSDPISFGTRTACNSKNMRDLPL